MMINALGSEQFFTALLMEMQPRKLYLTSSSFTHFVEYFVYALSELSDVGLHSIGNELLRSHMCTEP